MCTEVSLTLPFGVVVLFSDLAQVVVGEVVAQEGIGGRFCECAAVRSRRILVARRSSAPSCFCWSDNAALSSKGGFPSAGGGGSCGSIHGQAALELV